MSDGIESIHKKIRSFQKKYYLNIFLRGSILTLSIVGAYFVLASLLEHSLWLESWARLTIFITFFAIVVYCVYHFLKEPLSWWIAKRGLGEEQSARLIGSTMPGVRDRLVNLLQLGARTEKSSLAYASIQQKAADLAPLPFDSVIDLRKNVQFLKYLLIPGVVIFIILVVNRQILTDSTSRIIHFNQKFSPQPPFNFIIANDHLAGFFNEDFLLSVKLEGEAVPEDVYLHIGSQRFKFENQNSQEFLYRFENLQSSFSFQLEAAGFYSNVFNLNVINRPELTGFNIGLSYPPYLQRKSEHLTNAGNLEVPEGTNVTWNLLTAHANGAQISFSADSSVEKMQLSDNQVFTYSKQFRSPDRYEITLQNDESRNRDKIQYRIEIIKDQHPKIAVNNFKDSILYKRVVLGGIVSDDYGVTKLNLHYRILDKQQNVKQNQTISIPLIKNQVQQSFIYNWSLDSVKVEPGEQLEYYLRVWDNDGVNGSKSTQSAVYNFLVPEKDKLITEINKTSKQTQNQIDKSATKADDLQNKIDNAAQRLKGKQNLDWQDRKTLEDILKQKDELDKMIDNMQTQNKALQEKKEAFTKEDERIREKAEQLQKLMDDLLDEETKKMFEDLRKLLEEKTDASQMQKLLDQLNQNTDNLEKELDRILELFKQLEYESKFDQTLQQLKEQVKEQQELLEKTNSLEQQKENNKEQSGKERSQKNRGKNEEKNNSKEIDQQRDSSENPSEKQSSEELAKEQEELREEFKKTTEQMEELREMGKEIENPGDIPKQEENDEIQQEQQESQEQLEQDQPSKAKPSQQRAIQQMQQQMQQMESAQSAMSMEIDMQNLEMLRQIIHGLIKLSYDQEDLMKSSNELNANDPQFNALAEKQLHLKDNAQVLEDSLLALAKRDPFMGSFVTKEISELNNHLDEVNEANRERKKSQAQNHMQLSMTSINNLALMLDSHFDMMMQMMANAKPSANGKSKKKSNSPSLSQLQQQLNDKIKELKNGGKSGRHLSEDLAEMAAEQERIRRALEEMQEKIKMEGGTPGGDLSGKMEQTELDLVNKNLTDQLIKRQEQILTRLLESEKSMREQDMDDERKGETAKDYEKELPKAFEEYLRLKEKEVELLKTVPPKLYPYYKKQVDEYFKRMGNE